MATTPTLPPPPPGYNADDVVSAPPPPQGYSASDVVAAQPSNPQGSQAPQDFTAAQLPASGGIEIRPQASGIFDVAQRELDKLRQAIRDRTGNAEGNDTAANLLTLPVDAPLRAVSGALQSERSEGNRLEGEKEAVKGIGDTLSLVSPIKSGVAAKAMEAVNAESSLNMASNILKSSSQLAKKAVANFKEVPVPDAGAIQAPLRDSFRATVNQLAQDANVPSSPNTSLRDVLKNAGNAIQDKARVVYNQLDEATGGRFQRFDEALQDIGKQMRSAINDPDKLTELEEQQRIVQQASDDAFFRAAREHGVGPEMAAQANADYKQGAALKDVQRALNTHINGGRTELVPDAEAIISVKGARKTLDRMYDSGRLQQALGERTEQMYKDFHDAFTQESIIKDRAKDAAIHNAKVQANQRAAIVSGATALGLGPAAKKAIDILK